MSKKIKWFKQEEGFGLGNFVMATPALRNLGAKNPVNVYFSDKKIETLYKKCPFMSILKMPPRTKAFATTSTGKKNRRRRESDSQSLFRVIASRDTKKMGNTYVDYEITRKLDKIKGKKYVAVFHGCLGNIYQVAKDVGHKTRQYIINSIISREYIPVLLGSKRDHRVYWNRNKLQKCLNYLGKLSLKDSVSLLGQCDGFISNDTGLYHVAGALDMKGLVLWKKTDAIRSRSTCPKISHAVCRNGAFITYKRYIDNFLKEIK